MFMDEKSDDVRRKLHGIKSWKPISLLNEILTVIQENENITYRRIKGKVKNVSDSTLIRYLLEMQELSLVERTVEKLETGSKMGGLKPGFISHYKITEAGLQLVGVMSEMESSR